MPGVVGVYTAADLDLEPFADRRPAGRHAGGDAPPGAGHGQGALHRRAGRGRGRRDARAGRRRRRARRRRLRARSTSLVDMTKALDDDAPKLFDEAATSPPPGPTGEDALDDAEVRVGARFVNQRLAAVPMEPSAALAAPDPETRRLHPLHAEPGPARLPGRDLRRRPASRRSKLRVVSTATGGGFGARIAVLPGADRRRRARARARQGRALHRDALGDDARDAARPRAGAGRRDRRHPRRQGHRPEGARDRRLRRLSGRRGADADAHRPDVLAASTTIPKVDFHFDAVVTNTTPIGAYRGAGPPGGDRAGRARDRHVRGRDRHGPGRGAGARTSSTEFPHQTVTGRQLRLRRVPRGARASAWPTPATTSCAPSRRRAATAATSSPARASGCAPTSSGPGFGSELGTCDGRARTARSPSPPARRSHGQGHETAYAQLVAGTLGIPMADVKVDPVRHQAGHARHGHDGLALAAGRRHRGPAAPPTRCSTRPSRLAAHLLEADAGDIEVVPGQGLGVAGSPASRDPVGASWPRAAADPSRAPEGFERRPGRRERLRDAGRDVPVRHPPRRRRGRHRDRAGAARPPHHRRRRGPHRATRCCVEGQVHGGIAQGVAQALFEEIAYDEDGNNVTGSLASYAIPSAGDLPTFETERTQTPTPRNPLGAKGIGESGAIGSTPAVWNAVVDALAHLGVRNIDMPAHAAAGLAGDQRSRLSSRARRQGVDVRDRRPEPDARPDRPGQLGLAAGLELGVQPAASASGTPQQAREQRVRAEAAVADADRVLVAEASRQRLRPCSPRG